MIAKHLLILTLFLSGISGFAQRYCFQLSGGYGRKLEFVTDSMSDYKKFKDRLLTGPTIVAEIDFLGFNQGVGFRYNRFSAQSSAKQIYVPGFGTNDIITTMSVNYIGVQYIHFYQIKRTHCYITSNGGVGYILYSEYNKFGEDDNTFNGNTFGFEGNIGLDYRILEYISIGIKINLLLAVIKPTKQPTTTTTTTTTTYPFSTQTSATSPDYTIPTTQPTGKNIGLSRLDGLFSITLFL